MASFHLQVTTADGMEFDGPCDRLIVRTTEGDVGILHGHVDYLAALKDVSEMRITVGNDTRVAAISGGFVSVTKAVTRVNAVTLEWADEIDEERAKRARDSAAEFLKNHQQKNREYCLAEMKLKRALNRIRVAGKD